MLFIAIIDPVIILNSSKKAHGFLNTLIHRIHDYYENKTH